MRKDCLQCNLKANLIRCSSDNCTSVTAGRKVCALSSYAAKQQADVLWSGLSAISNRADCQTTHQGPVGLNGCWMKYRHKAWVLSTRLCGTPDGQDAL